MEKHVTRGGELPKVFSNLPESLTSVVKTGSPSLPSPHGINVSEYGELTNVPSDAKCRSVRHFKLLCAEFAHVVHKVWEVDRERATEDSQNADERGQKCKHYVKGHFCGSPAQLKNGGSEER